MGRPIPVSDKTYGLFPTQPNFVKILMSKSKNFSIFAFHLMFFSALKQKLLWALANNVDTFY